MWVREVRARSADGSQSSILSTHWGLDLTQIAAWMPARWSQENFLRCKRPTCLFAAPYRLRTIMERQEGVVPQVRMRVGQKVTQAYLPGMDQVIYFTGDIIAVPETDRGCRTKITVRVDGDTEKLWQNWAHGLHRVTCYGDLGADLKRFCRFKGLKLVNEA